jgi:hypothetical protein
MKSIEKIAIKYLLIGLGVGLLNFFIPFISFQLSELIQKMNYEQIVNLLETIQQISGNVIFGTFIAFDSYKYLENKFLISLTGFLIPLFGVCFLILEKFLILKLNEHE